VKFGFGRLSLLGFLSFGLMAAMPARDVEVVGQFGHAPVVLVQGLDHRCSERKRTCADDACSNSSLGKYSRPK
jgi:hypothetical protein